MSYTKKAFVGIGVLFICQVLMNIIGYLLRLALARSLSAVEYGLLYAVLAFVGMFAVAQSFGLPDAVIQRLPQLKSTAEIKSMFLTVLYTQLFITGTIFVALVFLAPWLAATYFKSPIAVPLVIITGIYFFITPIEVMILATFQGLGRVQWYGYLTFARTAFHAMITLLLLWLGFGVMGAMMGFVLMYLLVPLLYVPLLRKVLPDFGSVKSKFDFSLLRPLFKVGIPVALTGTIGFFLVSIDTFFITFYRPLTDVALYNVALPTAMLLWFIGNLLYTVMLPITSELNAKKEHGVLREGIGRMYVYLMLFILPFATVLFVFPDIIINALFGGQYVTAAPTLQILVIGGILYAFVNLNTSVLTGIGETKRNLPPMLIAAGINVIGDILLIPRYGIIGSAIATLIAFTALLTMSIWTLRRVVEFSLPIGRILRVILATILFGTSVFWLRNALALPLWWKIIIGMLIGAAVYAAAVFLLRIVTVDEIKNLKKQVLRR